MDEMINSNAMNVTYAQFYVDKATGQNIAIKVTADGRDLSIPMQVGNRHYAEILRQVEAGTLVIQDADPAPEA